MTKFSVHILHSLGFIILLPVFLVAQDYNDEATLYDHLCVINKQWENRTPSPELLKTVKFPSDEERIKTHLLLVIESIESESNSDSKNSLLDKLESYAYQKRFPKNIYHLNRQPYFIDHQGTACAVGHLMQSSGYSNLANEIYEKANYSYIEELLDFPGLINWAENHDFSVNELAWIQPTYSATSSWDSLPGYPNAPVRSLVRSTHQNQESIIIVGDFDSIGQQSFNHIALFNGIDFIHLGEGLPSTPNDILVRSEKINSVRKNVIYAVGSFQINASHYNIAYWNGENWSFDTLDYSSDFHPAFLIQHRSYWDDYFVIAGHTNDSWEVIQAVKGEEYRRILELNGRATLLKNHYSDSRNTFFVGGEFDTINNTPTDQLVLSDMNGLIMSKYSGIDYTPLNLKYLDFNQVIMSLGKYSNDSMIISDGVSKYIVDSWQNAYANTNLYGFFKPNSYFTDAFEFDNAIFVSGNYAISASTFYGNNLGVYEPFSQRLRPVDVFSGTVTSINGWNNHYMLVGGSFESIDGSAAEGNETPYLAIKKSVNAHIYLDYRAVVHPKTTININSENINLKFPNSSLRKLNITTLSGQTVFAKEARDEYCSFPHNLSSGIYVITISGDKIESQKIVVP